VIAIIPIKEKKKEFLDEQERLIKLLKKKHPDLYEFLVEKEINLKDLRPYSAGLAAAFVVAASAGQPGIRTEEQLEDIKVEGLSSVDLRGLSEADRANLVWKWYGPKIKQVSQKYDLDPKIIYATIMIESGGDTNALRHEPRIGDASYGLGQILYGTARGIGFTGAPNDLFDPNQNIELIARYHRRNLDVYGTLTPQELTVAYNAGSPHSSPHPGHINKFNNWYERAKNYVG
jgi:soluble lytic murein transglycosylase-like protein